MQLTIDQAAVRLGKSARQSRYLIQTGSLAAKKVRGRWVIEADDLPLSDPQRAAPRFCRWKEARAQAISMMRFLPKDALRPAPRERCGRRS